MTVRVIAVTTFVLSVVTANLITARYGIVLGLITAGTFTAGLALLARDWVDETAGRWWVLGSIAAGAVLSAGMAGSRLAIASGVAFAVSELADWLVYRPMRRRGWVKAALASSLAGAPVDSILFLSIAGFPLWPGLPAQVAVKLAVTWLVVRVVVVARAVLRNRVRSEGA